MPKIINKTTLIFFCILLINIFINKYSYSQTVGVNQPTPDTSSILDIYSKNKGLIIPRLTTAEQNIIPSPAMGLVLYNSTINELVFWDGNSWEKINNKFISNTTGTGTPTNGGVSFNESGNPAHQSAELDINSDGNEKKGLLLARTIPASIITPTAEGLLIYNTSTNKISFYNGIVWLDFCTDYSSNTIGSGTFTSKGISINTNTIDPSAIVELSSTNKGLLIPRILPTERDNIISPIAGLIIYNTTDKSIDLYNGTEWRQLLFTAPAQPSSITGNFSVCDGNTETYSISAVPEATTYNWTVPSGTIITSGQGTTSIDVTIGSSTGNICINSENNCGISTYFCETITIQSAPSQPASITGNFNVCDGNTETYSISAVPEATTYNWTVPSGTIIASGQGTTSIDVTIGSSAGNICVNAENNCGISTYLCEVITISTPTVPPATVTATSTEICEGDQTQLQFTGGSGDYFIWHANTCNSTIIGGSNNLTVSPSVTTTYYGNWGNACGLSTCGSVTVTVKTLSTDPTSIVSSLNPACDGDLLTLTVNGGTLGTGAGWYWSVGILGSTCGDFINTGNTRTSTWGHNYPVIVYHVRAIGDCNTTDCVKVTVEHCP